MLLFLLFLQFGLMKMFKQNLRQARCTRNPIQHSELDIQLHQTTHFGVAFCLDTCRLLLCTEPSSLTACKQHPALKLSWLQVQKSPPATRHDSPQTCWERKKLQSNSTALDTVPSPHSSVLPQHSSGYRSPFHIPPSCTAQHHPHPPHLQRGH